MGEFRGTRAALKTTALQTLSRVFCDPVPREAFGVRSASAPLGEGGSWGEPECGARINLLGGMNATPISKRPFFSIAAWYGLIAPFAAAAIAGWILTPEPSDIRHPRLSFDAVFGFVACILISSVLASITSLFGIRRHGARVIWWKALVGFLASCLLYLILVGQYMTKHD